MIEQPRGTSQNALILDIPRQVADAAAQVIKIGSCAADRGNLKEALTSFEKSLPSQTEAALNERIYGNFDALKSAVRLAHSVTHQEPVPLLARLFRGAAVELVSKALESATPMNRDNLDKFAQTLEKDHPAIFYAAKVCVECSILDPRVDLDASLGV